MDITNVAVDKFANLMVRQGDDGFSSAVKRGRVFSVCNQAGVTTQAGLSATTPILCLPNPSGSGFRAKLWYASFTATVAFATAGAVFLAANTNPAAAAVTGTLTTAHRNLKLGGGAPGLVPMLAATLPAAPVAIDILGTGLTGAITTIPMFQALERWYNGAVLIEPGCTVSVQTGVATGASGGFVSFIWEEEDL